MKIRLKSPPIEIKGHSGYFALTKETTNSKVFVGLSRTSKYLYYVLCEIWSAKNKGQKFDSFIDVRYKEIEEYSGLSRSTIFLARKSLVEAGLIEEGKYKNE